MDTLVEYGKNFGLTREETRKTLFLQRPRIGKSLGGKWRVRQFGIPAFGIQKKP